MTTAVKLNQWEREALSERLIMLNKKLVMSGHKPIATESQIVHKILELTIARVDVTEDGNLKISEKF